MKKDLDVAALGEVLIDFTTAGTSGQNHMLFEANPGGAPCNVLALSLIHISEPTRPY